MIEKDLVEKIVSIPHFRQSQYSNLDVSQTLDYMRKRYITPIKEYLDITGLTLVDCGAGYGWLSFSYLMNGGGQAILCDINHERLEAAREIALILDLDKRCEFIHSPMQDLKFEEKSIDIFVSIETLEHVGDENIDACIQVMTSAAKKLILLTTPNKLFPVVIHDTKIPFAHWLPQGIRKHYVRLFGKTAKSGNDFVFPWRLRPLQRQFKPVSTVLTFPSVKAWQASYPFQSPYGIKNRRRERPQFLLKALYTLAATSLGRYSFILTPNLCRIWLRKEEICE